MSDLIFKTNGEEYFCIPSPFSNNYYHLPKCPETKLEIKMTETDISKVLIEGDYATIMGVKYKRVEEPKTPVEEAYKDWCGEYPSGTPSENAKWGAFLAGYQVTQPKAVPVDEPDWYDEVEWDEKDNPKPMDEVVNRLVKKYEAQKLWNMLRDELGYSVDCCDEIVDLVEKWLPKEQSAAGSQNVDTELLVDGFNHCLEKIKGMLR
jgi:hypothetical protein